MRPARFSLNVQWTENAARRRAIWFVVGLSKRWKRAHLNSPYRCRAINQCRLTYSAARLSPNSTSRHVVRVAPCLFQHGGRRRSSSARVYKFSILWSGFASVSGTTSGKSEVDMSTPVHAVATPLNTCRARRARRASCDAHVAPCCPTSSTWHATIFSCTTMHGLYGVSCRVVTWRDTHMGVKRGGWRTHPQKITVGWWLYYHPPIWMVNWTADKTAACVLLRKQRDMYAFSIFPP